MARRSSARQVLAFAADADNSELANVTGALDANLRQIETELEVAISRRGHQFRILRAVKNRFGSTNEVGVFQMAEQGLEEVPDPASVFLEEGDLRSGSVVVPGSLPGCFLDGVACGAFAIDAAMRDGLQRAFACNWHELTSRLDGRPCAVRLRPRFTKPVVRFRGGSAALLAACAIRSCRCSTNGSSLHGRGDRGP